MSSRFVVITLTTDNIFLCHTWGLRHKWGLMFSGNSLVKLFEGRDVTGACSRGSPRGSRAERGVATAWMLLCA